MTPTGPEKVEFHEKSSMHDAEPFPAIVATNPSNVTERMRLFPASATAREPSMGDMATPRGSEN